jgi:uncharacterized coiled-coil protein SlyX
LEQSTERQNTEESTDGGRSGMTQVPGQVQRAAARLADSDQEVYHVRVVLGGSARDRDRDALVTGLEDSQTALELLDSGADDADALEFVTAPRFGIETVTDAIDRCSFVEGVNARRLLGVAETADENHGTQRTIEGATTSAGDEPAPWSAARGDSAGPFALPEDEVSLTDVIEQAHEGSVDDTGRTDAGGATAAGETGGGADDRCSQQGKGGDTQADTPSPVRPDSAIDARVSHLESRFAQFEAYVDELETLLDRQCAYQRRVARLEDDLEDLEASVGDIDDESARHRRRITAVRDAVEAATRERDDLANTLQELQDGQGRLEDDVDELSSWRERLSDALRPTTE